MNLAVYQLSLGDLEAAAEVIARLREQRSSPHAHDVDWELIWLKVNQVEAVLLSMQGHQRQALAGQEMVVEGLELAVGRLHPDALQARLVRTGIQLLLGEYVIAKERAGVLLEEVSATFPNTQAVLLSPALLLSLANHGLDRFQEAANGLLKQLDALSEDVHSMPLAAYAELVAAHASCNTDAPVTGQSPPDLDKHIRPVAVAVSHMFGPRCEVTAIDHLALAEMLIGYDRHNESGNLMRHLLATFLDVDKPLCGIRSQWHCWAAGLSLGSLLDVGQYDTARLVADTVADITATRCGVGSVVALRAAMERISPMLLGAGATDAVDQITGALQRSVVERGEDHPETLEIAATTLQVLASAAAETERRDYLSAAHQLVSQFDQPLADREEQHGYARLNRGVLAWEMAKVMLLAYEGRVTEAADAWESIRDLASTNFGRVSAYARSYRLFDDVMWQVRSDNG